MKNLIVFGAPAAGKGTLAKYLAEEYGLLHLSTGHIFRTEFYIKPEYKKLKEDLEAGLFASDKLAIKAVEGFLDSNDLSKGVVFDGFPRDIKQAEAFEEILKSRGMKLDFVFDLEVNEEDVIKRVSGRYSCKDCGASYNTEHHQTEVKGVCDACGSRELYTREEDSPKALKERMVKYLTRTQPLIEYYAKKGVLQKINASTSVEEVQKQADSCFSD